MCRFSASHIANGSFKVPEHEYQVRVGAAIRHLRESLPQFMEQGLLDRDGNSINKSVEPYFGTRLFMRRSYSNQIYHKHIYFRFCPPLLRLPDTEQGSFQFKPGFSLHGRRMYLASSQWLRWTLRALFLDVHIFIEHLSLMPSTKAPLATTDPESDQPIPRDELMMRIRFRGSSRVSGTIQDYVMLFRYRFDRNSGMICEHYVDEMIPSPKNTTVPATPFIAGRGDVD